MDMDAPRFTVLLAEDDPVSQAFLVEALRDCGAEVTAYADGTAALAAALAQRFDLMLLDQHLPGCHGDAVLAALRADGNAASHATPAIATSAELDGDASARTRAGFAEALPKPMTLADLHAALRRHGLGAPVARVLDDDAAVRACGSASAVARLRQLFADDELPRLAAELERTRDPRALRPSLHRLRAACGFCGASGLADAAVDLQRALDDAAGDRDHAPALARFRVALQATRAALAATPAS